MIKCKRKCLIEPDCSEQLMAIRLAVEADIAANICLVIYCMWGSWRRRENGKAECKHSPTLNEQYVRDILGKVVCNGEYDENVVKNRVKRVNVYE